MDQDPGSPVPTAEGHADDAADSTVGQAVTMPDVESTGVDAVDRVLAEVTAVADAPVSDHVEVFERAHEQLRRALDAQPPPAADGERGV